MYPACFSHRDRAREHIVRHIHLANAPLSCGLQARLLLRLGLPHQGQRRCYAKPVISKSQMIAIFKCCVYEFFPFSSDSPLQ